MAKAINIYIKLINIHDSKKDIFLYVLSTIELNMVYKSSLIFIHPLHYSWKDGSYPGILLHNLNINKSRIQVRAALKKSNSVIQAQIRDYMMTFWLVWSLGSGLSNPQRE